MAATYGGRILTSGSLQLRPELLQPAKPRTLLEWVSHPQFFPKDFGVERVEVRAGSIWVTGAEEIYRFPYAADGAVAGPEIRQRWRAACEHLSSLRDLAPGLSLGPRTLRWQQGVPVWIQDGPLTTFRARSVPRGSEEVAIVLRRFQNQETLEQTARRSESAAEAVVRRCARILGTFHARARVQNAGASRGIITLGGLEQRYLPAPGAGEEGLSTLEVSGYREARAFLCSYLRRKYEVLAARARSEAFGQVHGRLSMRHVVSGKFRSTTPQVFVLGRGAGVSGDVLEDVAALDAELSARGYSALAKVFREQYRAVCGELWNEEVFRFYSAAARLACSFHGPAGVTSALDQAFRLPETFLAAIDDTGAVRESNLAEEFAGLTGAVLLVPAGGAAGELSGWAADAAMSSLLQRCESELQAGRRVVVAAPLRRQEWRASLESIAARRSASFVRVIAQWGRDEQVRHDLAGPVKSYGDAEAGRRSRFGSGSGGPSVWYEPQLPRGENGLALLREISCIWQQSAVAAG